MMTRADIITALALLPESDAIACLLAAGSQREAHARAERRRQRMDDEQRRGPDASHRALVIAVCCEVYGVTSADVLGTGRARAVREARACCYVLMLDLLDMLPREVAEAVGRERSTIATVAKRARGAESQRALLARSLAVDALDG